METARGRRRGGENTYQRHFPMGAVGVYGTVSEFWDRCLVIIGLAGEDAMGIGRAYLS